MKAFFRFLLLATSAALGVGLAVWIIVFTGSDRPQGQSSRLSVCAATPDGAANKAFSNESPENAAEAAKGREILRAVKADFALAQPHLPRACGTSAEPHTATLTSWQAGIGKR